MKKQLILFLLMLTTVFFSQAEILTLKKVRDRPYDPVTLSQEFKQKMKKETKGLKENEIVAYCNDKTKELLEFSTKCEKFDDKKKTKMHCVGYAQVLATICNYAFTVNGIKGSAKPVVGHVYINGINLNDCSKMLPGKWKNFTKDHDFVEVKLSGGKTMFVDACLDIIQ